MKKLLLSLALTTAAAFTSQAEVVLNEPFSYADGSLITVSSGLWSTHSGTTGQVDVASGKVNLTGFESEDVNAPLASSPHTTGNLYASFVVNFSALPVSGGAYFAHFKDSTTSGFRGRLFALTTGAASGQFRLGIINASGTPTTVPLDLSLNTDYLVVMRYDTAAAASTVWINPGSESATSNRADATDSTSTLPISTFGLRQANSMGTLTMDDLKVGTAFSDVVTDGNSNSNPPIISNIADQSIPANASTAAIAFTVADGETPAANLTLSKSSSNTTLIPTANIVFGGSGTNRTVTITPAAGQQGTAEVTITVTDSHTNSAVRSFTVTVGAPSISAIANQTTPTNTPSAAIAFTVGDNESAASTLTLSATSNNEALVPTANIVFGGSGANRTATITPGQDQVGTAIVTITVTDGINSASSTFRITVYPLLGLDFADSFDYPDGPITSSSGFTWNTHSASTGQTNTTLVSGGKLLLSGTNSEDINAFLNRSPYDTNSGAILYSSFKVNFNTLPTQSGYFAHFRDTSGGFRARVFVTTNNAAAGKFRLGISNGGNTFDELPTDLSLNTEYTVVTRYNVGTTESALWVNPLSEASPSVKGTDSQFPQWILTYAFRQTTGMGALSVDDLKIGMAFSDVATVTALPPTITVSKIANGLQLSWSTTDAGYALQSATTLGGAWSPAVETPAQNGTTYTVNILAPAGNKFYRLVK